MWDLQTIGYLNDRPKREAYEATDRLGTADMLALIEYRLEQMSQRAEYRSYPAEMKTIGTIVRQMIEQSKER